MRMQLYKKQSTYKGLGGAKKLLEHGELSRLSEGERISGIFTKSWKVNFENGIEILLKIGNLSLLPVFQWNM